MRGSAWLALDAIGHRIPRLRLGRVRAYICEKADAEIWRRVGTPPTTEEKS